MSNWWKSLFLVWFPVALILSITHDALWGDYDMSSFYFGMAFIFVSQTIEKIFDLD